MLLTWFILFSFHFRLVWAIESETNVPANIRHALVVIEKVDCKSKLKNDPHTPFSSGDADIQWPRGNLSSSDYYEILGVDKKATLGEIKKAYHQLALFTHPDKNNNASIERFEVLSEAFKKIARAFEVLSSQELRSRYDSGELTGNSNNTAGETSINPALWNLYQRWLVAFSKGLFQSKGHEIILKIFNSGHIFNLDMLADPKVRTYLLRIARGEILIEYQRTVISYLGYRPEFPEFRNALIYTAKYGSESLRQTAYLSMAVNYEHISDFKIIFETEELGDATWHKILTYFHETVAVRPNIIPDIFMWLENQKIKSSSAANFLLALSILEARFSDIPLARQTLINIATGSMNVSADLFYLYFQQKKNPLPSEVALRLLIPHYLDPEVKLLLNRELTLKTFFSDDDIFQVYLVAPELRNSSTVKEEIRNAVESKPGWDMSDPFFWKWNNEDRKLTPNLLKVYAKLDSPNRIPRLKEIAENEKDLPLAIVAIDLLGGLVDESEARSFLINLASENVYYRLREYSRQEQALKTLLKQLDYADVLEAVESIASTWPFENVGKLAQEALNNNKIRPHHPDQSNVWAALRKSDSLVAQGSIPGRQGLCGVACAVNILQAATLLAGHQAIINVQKVFTSFVEANIESPGVGPSEIQHSLEKLFSTYTNIDFKISAIQLSGVHDPDHFNIKPIEKIDLSLLNVNKKKLKILLSAQMNHSINIVGYHAQIIESFYSKKLKLVDPNSPHENLFAEYNGEIYINGLTPWFSYVGHDNSDGIVSLAPVSIITIEIP